MQKCIFVQACGRSFNASSHSQQPTLTWHLYILIKHTDDLLKCQCIYFIVLVFLRVMFQTCSSSICLLHNIKCRGERGIKKIWVSSEQKKLLRCNKKHFHNFLGQKKIKSWCKKIQNSYIWNNPNNFISYKQIPIGSKNVSKTKIHLKVKNGFTKPHPEWPTKSFLCQYWHIRNLVYSKL